LLAISDPTVKYVPLYYKHCPEDDSHLLGFSQLKLSILVFAVHAEREEQRNTFAEVPPSMPFPAEKPICQEQEKGYQHFVSPCTVVALKLSPVRFVLD
jgi:hypothetical protein